MNYNQDNGMVPSFGQKNVTLILVNDANWKPLRREKWSCQQQLKKAEHKIDLDFTDLESGKWTQKV